VSRAYKRPPKKKPRYKPKPVGKKGRKPSPNVDYKPLSINEKEVDKLLEIAETIKYFPKGLIPRLKDLKEVFQDELNKLKELIIRNRANAFYNEPPKLKKGGDYTDVVALSAAQMRRRLDKQRVIGVRTNGHKEK